MTTREVLALLQQSAEQAAREQYDGALAALDRALQLEPMFTPAQVQRASLLMSLDRPESAVACLSQVLRQAPELAQVRQLRQTIAASALAGCDRVLAIATDDVPALRRRGNLAMLLQDYAAALAAYTRLLQHEPEDADARINCGNCCAALGRYDEALQQYDAVLAAHPNQALAAYNRGTIHRKLNRSDDAMRDFARAVAIASDLAEARLAISHCLLAQGDYRNGWREFEWRWRTRQLAGSVPPLPTPRWRGDFPLAGKTILLWAEQGLGDTLQFARFLPLVAAQGAALIVRIPAALQALFMTLPCPMRLISLTDPLPEHDCHCPLMSLPLALGTTLASIPAAVPYFRAEADAVAQWRQRLAGRRRPLVEVA